MTLESRLSYVQQPVASLGGGALMRDVKRWRW